MADLGWALRLLGQIEKPIQPDGTIRFAADAPGLWLTDEEIDGIRRVKKSVLRFSPLDANLAWIWIMCSTFWIVCLRIMWTEGANFEYYLDMLGGCAELYDTVCVNLRALSAADRDESATLRLFSALRSRGAEFRVGVPIFKRFATEHGDRRIPLSARRLVNSMQTARDIFSIMISEAFLCGLGDLDDHEVPPELLRGLRFSYSMALRHLPDERPTVAEKIMTIVRRVIKNRGVNDSRACAVLLDCVSVGPPTLAELRPAKEFYAQKFRPKWRVWTSDDVKHWLENADDWARRAAWVGAVVQAGLRDSGAGAGAGAGAGTG